MDSTAYSTAFLAHRHDLQAFILGMTGDALLSEDILQEVWVALADAAAKDQSIEHLPAWCRSVAKHTILRHWRRNARQRYLEDEAIFDLVDAGFETQPDPGQHWATVRIAALQDCLGRLQEGARRLLERRHLDGIAVEALASEERTSSKALVMRLSRLRDTLRACVEGRVRHEP